MAQLNSNILMVSKRGKHNIVFNPVEPYRHTMQGYIENLVKQMKVHSMKLMKQNKGWRPLGRLFAS